MTDAGPLGAGADERRRWAGLVLLLFGVLLIVMDQTITAVVLPQISRELAIGVDTASLTITVFILSAAVSLTAMGQIADHVGRRRMICLGFLAFAAGSLVTGSATGLWGLIAGRVLQGITFAALTPAILGIVNVTFPGGPARTLAFALWSMTSATAVALGPLIGGAFAGFLTWRYAFYINIPICLALSLGALRFLERDAARGDDLVFDLPGIALFGVTMVAIVLGFQEGGTFGWFGPSTSLSIFGLSPVPFLIVLGLLSGVALVAVERRRAVAGRAVLIEPQILATRSFRLSLLASASMSMALYGLMILLPIYTQFVLGADPLESGAALFLLGVGMGAGGLLSSRLIGGLGRRRTAMVCLAVQCVFLLAMVPMLRAAGSTIAIGLLLLGYGIAYAAAFSAQMNLLLVDMPSALSSRASGLASTIRLGFDAFATAIMVGLMIGIAVSATQGEIAGAPALSSAERGALERMTHFRVGSGAAEAEDRGLLTKLAAAPSTRPLVADLRSGFVEAGRGGLLAALFFVIVALCLSFRLPKDRPIEGVEDMKGDRVVALYRAIDAGDHGLARGFLTPDFRHRSTRHPTGLDADR